MSRVYEMQTSQYRAKPHAVHGKGLASGKPSLALSKPKLVPQRHAALGLSVWERLQLPRKEVKIPSHHVQGIGPYQGPKDRLSGIARWIRRQGHPEK